MNVAGDIHTPWLGCVKMQRMERQLGITCIFTGTEKCKEWKYKKRRDRKMQGTEEVQHSKDGK